MLANESRAISRAIRPLERTPAAILPKRKGSIAASAGINGLRGTEWAVERFNAHAGRRLELVVEDETSPKDTIGRCQRLVQQEKVDCVQGIVSTGVGLALGPVVEEAWALTIYWDGTTQDGVDETLPNPKYLEADGGRALAAFGGPDGGDPRRR